MSDACFGNIGRFYEVAGKEVVDYKLENSIKGAVAEITYWRPGNGEFNEARNAELIKLLQSLDYAFIPGALASLYTAEYVRKGDYKGMLNSMREAFKYNVFRNGEEQMYFQITTQMEEQEVSVDVLEEGRKGRILR